MDNEFHGGEHPQPEEGFFNPRLRQWLESLPIDLGEGLWFQGYLRGRPVPDDGEGEDTDLR